MPVAKSPVIATEQERRLLAAALSPLQIIVTQVLVAILALTATFRT